VILAQRVAGEIVKIREERRVGDEGEGVTGQNKGKTLVNGLFWGSFLGFLLGWEAWRGRTHGVGEFDPGVHIIVH
jgi:hypothetical protein